MQTFFTKSMHPYTHGRQLVIDYTLAKIAMVFIKSTVNSSIFGFKTAKNR